MRHWIREIDWIMAHHPQPFSIPAHHRFLDLKNKVYSTVKWFDDITQTFPLGPLPERFEELFEEIRADYLKRVPGYRPNPIHDATELAPIGGYDAESDYQSEEWTDDEIYDRLE